MAIAAQTKEIQRLVEYFERKSSDPQDLRFRVHYIGSEIRTPAPECFKPNHAIKLWGFCGLAHARGVDQLVQDFANRSEKWGIPCELSAFGVLDGTGCPEFLTMAKRAGSVFNQREVLAVNSRVHDGIVEFVALTSPNDKPVIELNSNPLAVWLNYLLYQVSLIYPGRELSSEILPEPFTLSLLALEDLQASQALKSDRSPKDLSSIRFRVALSFPGQKRGPVSRILERLRPHFGADEIFYDYDYQSQLARPNLDSLLQRIYRDQSDLVVVFLCSEYAGSEWCGLEWRAIRDIIKSKADDRVMFVRWDNSPIEGVLSLDGYIDANRYSPDEIARFIIERASQSLPAPNKPT